MFNEERKLAFIRETCNSVASRDIPLAIFRAVEPYENKYGDVCSWDEHKIVEFFRNRYSNIRTLRSRLNTIKQYHRWCIQNGYQETGDILRVNPEDLLGVDPFRERMVENPTELCNYLNTAFRSAESKNKSCLTFRAYYWLSFCGVPEQAVFSLTKDLIDIENRVIVINGFRVKIIREASESVSGLYYAGDYEDALIKSENQKLNSNNISAYILLRHNPDIKRLLYRDVYKSGLFYRVYRQEKLGFPIRFDNEIELQISVTGYSGVGNSLHKRKKQLQSTLKREYEMWKTAFALDV